MSRFVAKSGPESAPAASSQRPLVLSVPRDRRPACVAMAVLPEAGGRGDRALQAYWAVAGFVLGVLFWHMVGFWDFLGGVVFRSNQPASLVEQALQQPAGAALQFATSQQPELAARIEAAHCTTLVFDRMSGRTIAEPCMLIIRKFKDQQEASVSPAAPMQTAPRLDVALNGE